MINRGRDRCELSARLLRRSKMSDGVALLEFAFVVPLLLLFFVAVFEAGRAFNQYMILSQVAYEGARVGIQLDGVSESCFDNAETTDLGWQEDGVTPADLKYSHYLAQKRVAFLLAKLSQDGYLKITGEGGSAAGDNDTLPAPPTISSQFVGTSPSAACGGLTTNYKNTFALRIEGSYHGAVLPVSFEMRATSTGSLLATNNLLVNPQAPKPPTVSGGGGVDAPGGGGASATSSTLLYPPGVVVVSQANLNGGSGQGSSNTTGYWGNNGIWVQQVVTSDDGSDIDVSDGLSGGIDSGGASGGNRDRGSASAD